MLKNFQNRYDPDLDDVSGQFPVRNTTPEKHYDKARRKTNQRKKQALQVQAQQLHAQSDQQETQFEFTYLASRHEREWIVNSLGNFYQEHWLKDVLRLVKGGKEAHVYQCLAPDQLSKNANPYLAAKVYRPRMFRNLRNDKLYRQGRANLDADGREIIDDRMLHAIQKRTRFGMQLMHTSWIEHEVKALQTLHQAGADVPEVYASGHNAILMSYIGGPDVAAPTLNTVELEPQEARPLFDRLIHNLEIMLAHQLVHGDFSAYNVLYWDGEITIIDFPQVIHPEKNRQAYHIFERDVTRLCEYFSRQGVASQPQKLAADLWTAYNYHLRPEIDPALLDADDPEDRAAWRKNAS